MIRSRYYCDRCDFDVTVIGAKHALYHICINRPGEPPLEMDVCKECIKEICKLINGIGDTSVVQVKEEDVYNKF